MEQKRMLSGIRLSFSFILLAILSSCTSQPPVRSSLPSPPVSTTFVIDGAQIWDGTGSPPVQDAVLIVAGDRIEAVGARGSLKIPAGAKTIPAQGKTLIP